MIKRFSCTYHFEKFPDGNAPDDSGPRREIAETANMLALDYEARTGPERRAIVAMREGFTMEQYRVFDALVERAIRARRARHADRQGVSALSRSVLLQTEQIERRWRETKRDLELLLGTATEVWLTGLEPNSEERRAESPG